MKSPTTRPRRATWASSSRSSVDYETADDLPALRIGRW